MEDVLPSIRKNGCYMSKDIINKTLEDPDFIIKIATKLKKEREEKLLEKERADKLQFAITIGQFAKLLNNNNINKRTPRNSREVLENYQIKSVQDLNTE